MQLKIMTTVLEGSENTQRTPLLEKEGKTNDTENCNNANKHLGTKDASNSITMDQKIQSPFDFHQFHQSLPKSCDLIPHCGTLSSSCGSVFDFKKDYKNITPFSIPSSDANVFINTDVAKESKNFSTLPKNVKKSNSSAGNPKSSNHAENVVITQPSTDHFQRKSSQCLPPSLTSCTCVNPGIGHACVSRSLHGSPFGVLNPMFDQERSALQDPIPHNLKVSRRFSLDSAPKSEGSDYSDFLMNPSIARRASDIQKIGDKEEPLFSSSSSIMPKIPSINKSCVPGVIEESVLPFNINDQNKNVLQNILTENVIPSNVNFPGVCKSNSQRQENTQTVDVLSILTPSPDSFGQRLFSPEDLRDELLFPSPFGITSEVYQNLNAREADFVLGAPLRKPKLESLSMSKEDKKNERSLVECSLDRKNEKKEISNELKNETEKYSLSARRKSSLEKIFIPPVRDESKILQDTKFDNFDRDEYIKFKKRLSASEDLMSDLMKQNTSSYQIKPFSLPSKTKSDDVLDILHHRSNDRKKGISQTENLRMRTSSIDKVPDKRSSLSKGLQNSDIKSSVCVKDKNRKTDKSDISNSQIENISDPQNSKFSKKSLTSNCIRAADKITCSRADQMWNNDYNSFKRHLAARRANRKQSLPTEEIFCSRPSENVRKPSFNPLDYQALRKITHLSSNFSPVKESDENFFSFEEEQTKRKPLPKRHSIASTSLESKADVSRGPPKMGHEKWKKENQCSNRKILSPSFLNEDSRALKERSKHKKKKTNNHTKSEYKDTSSPKSHHHHHHPHAKDNPTKHLRRGKMSSNTCNRDALNTSSSQSHRDIDPYPSTSKHKSKSRTTTHSASKGNSFAYSSALGPGYEAYSPDEEVPYKRLEESFTTDSPQSLDLFCGSSKHRRNSRDLQRKQRSDEVYYITSDSSKSSCSSKSNSDCSSSSSSSSEQTSSSSSESSDSDSSSSSSSSSDFSEIQDLIL